MSSKAIEWARTHQFENGAVVRTAILRFLAEQADDDGYIADHEGDKGVAFIMHETSAGKRTVIRTLKEFEDADLLHRERRPYKQFGGRPTDLIVLHLYNIGTKTPWRTLKTLKQIHKAGQAHFGAPIETLGELTQPVDNSASTLGATLAPNYETPSQKQGASLAPTESWVPERHNLGATLAQQVEPPLIGTRARTIPMTIPVSQSVKEEAPVDNSQTDRPTEEAKKDKTRPRITRGVNHQQLRHSLSQAGHDTTTVPEDVLAQIITIIFARSAQDVRSPQRFAFSCITNEFHELVSLAESVIDHNKPAPAPQRKWCDFHTREYTCATCPVCSNPRLANIPGERTSS